MSSWRSALLAQAELGGDILWWDEPWQPEESAQSRLEKIAPVDLKPQEQQKWSELSVNGGAWNWLPIPELLNSESEDVFWQGLEQAPPYVSKIPLRDKWRQGVPVAVVGLAPTGELFWSEAEEQLLANLLAKVLMLRPEDCYRTLFSKIPLDRPMFPRQRVWHRQVLLRELQLLKPKAVLVLGEEAARALLQKGDAIGSLTAGRHEVEGIPIWAIWSLADFLRETQLRHQALPALKDLGLFLQQLDAENT
jgi:uracil-DNA glycosylase family 4